MDLDNLKLAIKKSRSSLVQSPQENKIKREDAAVLVNTSASSSISTPTPSDNSRSTGKSVNSRRRELFIEYTRTQKFPLDPDHLERQRIITACRSPDAISAYKVLRTRILQKMFAHHWNSLGVVTARSGQGGSLTAINLGISLAQEITHSVLLVDLNFRNPSLHLRFGIEPRLGIWNALFQAEELENVLVKPDIERLVLLPCLSPIDDASELLSSPRLQELTDDIKQRYSQRIVVFDLPPVLEGDEVLAFLPNVDALLIVVEENGTAKEDLLQMSELLKGTPVLGTVLNKSRN